MTAFWIGLVIYGYILARIWQWNSAAGLACLAGSLLWYVLIYSLLKGLGL